MWRLHPASQSSRTATTTRPERWMLHTSDGICVIVQPSFLDLLERRQKTTASTPTHSLNVSEERGKNVSPFVRRFREKVNTSPLSELHRDARTALIDRSENLGDL